MFESSQLRCAWRLGRRSGGRAKAAGCVGTALAVAFSAALLSAGCGVLGNLISPSTTPSTSSSTNTTETFTGTLAVQSSNLFSFTVAQAGTVSLTLSTLSATGPVGLGVGTPNGATACTLTSSNSTALAGPTPQIMVTENPGTYCVSVYDVGNLTGPAAFSITVVHP
jgi:hypothetical protein